MAGTLNHPHGRVQLTELDNGRLRVDVTMSDPGAFVMDNHWETAYPPELIAAILFIKGPAWLCDELRRDEDPAYVENDIRHDVLGFVAASDFEGKSVLDFGCGCGASLCILSRLVPGASVTGVELDKSSLNIARMRAKHYGLSPQLKLSPDSMSLPPGLGTFDYILFSAVFEHLLPDERLRLLPRIWAHLKPGGVLFLNQTPHRWFPIEGHTTGLPLPHRVANQMSRRIAGDTSWPTLLRMGVRGGTVGEITSILRDTDEQPQLLAPTQMGLRDYLDLWDKSSSARHGGSSHRLKAAALRLIQMLTGRTLVPNLSLAIRKEEAEMLAMEATG
jgi:SAM-dependent methyltransferase